MNTRRIGGAYQGAVEATLAVVISVVSGVYADTKLDTSPTFLFTGLAVGFGAFILRLTRLLREVGGPDDDKADKPGSLPDGDPAKHDTDTKIDTKANSDDS